MFGERKALEIMFMKLDEARERRYQQHLAEMQVIEKEQNRLLNELRRIDDDARLHMLEMKSQAEVAPVTEATKKRLGKMNQNLVVKRSEPIKAEPIAIPKPSEPIRFGSATVIPKDPEPPKPDTMGKPVFEDGKRINPDKTVQYQLYYVCPSCGHKGTRFIYPSSLETFCKACNKTMKVEKATEKGFPHQDARGNYFIAGRFQRMDLYEQKTGIAPNPVDDILAKYEAEREAEKELVFSTAKGKEDTPIAAALKKAVTK